MDFERWTRLEVLFHGAAELHGEARERFLRDGCGTDEELLSEIRSLLSKTGDAEKFIERPALEKAAEILVESETVILPGRRVGQYIVGEPLGKGGMGDVFRAHDTKLDRDVALKVLPAAFRSDPGRLHRFEREARTVTKLNHPNIVTVFDIGLVGDAHYIATELVEGKTLRRLMSNRRLGLGETVGIMAQIAEALAAAHASGIVHRDIKPENVMVRPDGYVKVLDFGLARSVRRPEPEAATMASTLTTDPGTILGTVAYMSPEQARGYDVDGRTDLWSLGVILYEIAFGKRPFTGETSNDVIAAILTAKPELEGPAAEGLPENLKAILRTALSKSVDDRYATAEDLRDDLKRLGREVEDQSPGVGNSGSGSKSALGKTAKTDPNERLPTDRKLLHTLPFLRTRTFRNRLLAAGCAGLLLFTGWAGYQKWQASRRQPPPTEAVPEIKIRKSVAILGFRNLLGNEQEWISPALSEMLRSELSAGERLRIISGDRVARVKVERDLKESDEPAEETVAKIRTELRADYLIYGGFTILKGKNGNQVRLDARIRETATDRVITVIESGTEEQLFALVARIGLRLREKLDLGSLNPQESAALRATLPANQEAARLYAEGVAKLRQFDALAARDLLEKAVAADPEYPLSHAALAETWTALGYDARALAEAKKAFDASSKLSREESLLVEARYREAAKEWDKATGIYHTLFTFYPDDLEYGLRLVSAQTAAGGKDAFDTIARLQKLPDSVRDDTLIDLSEAQAAESLRDFQRESAAAARASASGIKRGARLLVARAKMADGWGKTQTGNVKEGISLIEEARGIFTVVGDRNGAADATLKIGFAHANLGDNAAAEKNQKESLAQFQIIGNKRGQARAMVAIGNGFFSMGNYREARKIQESALAIFREVGNRNGEAVILNNLGNTLRELEDEEGSRRNYEAALAIFRDLGNRSGESTALDGLGALLADNEKTAEALKWNKQSLSVKQALGDREGVALTHFNIGLDREKLGDLPGSKRDYTEGITITREIESKTKTGIGLYRLANLLFLMGEYTEAEKNFQEALTLFTEAGEKGWIAGTQQSYGRMLGDTGRGPEAEKLLHESIAEYQSEKIAYLEASSTATLARILVREGKPGPARAMLNRARFLKKKDSPKYYDLIEAEILAAEGRFAEALKLVRAARPILQSGEVQYQFEADFVEAEIRSKSEKGTDRATLFAAITRAALAKGFGNYVKRATSGQ